MIKPDLLFEVSWEVCNKVGGIYTVISTKAPFVHSHITSSYILIGALLGQNPDFEPDETLYPELVESCNQAGITIKCGRWNINSNPIVILIDFNYIYARQDAILSKLWERFGVDSLTGGWDYIEPVLFGWSAGELIERFMSIYHQENENVVAHFHEWMCVSGAMYLKSNNSSASTVFTTHATTLGRAMASSKVPIYSSINSSDTYKLSEQYGIRAKHSIESIGARVCDGFSTVSNITAAECERFLGCQPNVITPNGFDDKIVWSKDKWESKRRSSHTAMTALAQKLLGITYKENEPFIVLTSGRYEFFNKGIDIFIEAIKKIAKKMPDKDVLAYITVPAAHGGIVDRLYENTTNHNEIQIANISHYLNYYDEDPIVKAIKDSDVVQGRSRCQIIFVPIYIDTTDNLFGRTYYELLVGADMTVFPSYYEPWGYTPVESIALGIPSLTTSLSGFGDWIEDKRHGVDDVINVITRTDENYDLCIEGVFNAIRHTILKSEKEWCTMSRKALKMGSTVSWGNLIDKYNELYNIAIQSRKGVILEKSTTDTTSSEASSPHWRRIMVERDMPQSLSKLNALMNNLWWVWSKDGGSLFSYIDNNLWRKSNHNPVCFFDKLSSKRLDEIISDHYFTSQLETQYDLFKKYMRRDDMHDMPTVAYFSMEYGLVNFLKIYSGGLGILAGDYIKEASDRCVPMVAVGLLYRYGYFSQRISAKGDQETEIDIQNFYKLPLTPVRDNTGAWRSISIEVAGRVIVARIWECKVGRISLYLLDTDYEVNMQQDRQITHSLYGGDTENRIKQEIVLGIGGIKALSAIGIKPDLYHCNEGHAAFMLLERVANLTDNGIDFATATEIIRSSSLFTTHTPVPAGHDYFSQELLKKYIGAYTYRLGVSWETILRLGIPPQNSEISNKQLFSMSDLACRLSGYMNGVSKIHGEVTRGMFENLWNGYFASEVPIGYVTNGVHIPSWISQPMRKLYEETFECSIIDKSFEEYNWKAIENIEAKTMWNTRLEMKERLIRTIKRRVTDPSHYRFDSPRQMIKVKESISQDVLTIGFARRYATYKRGTLLLSNLERLDKIVNNPEYPVQIIFAGKAHPKDKEGMDIIRRIVQVASMPQFIGKIIFMQNYNIQLARKLCSGVDVWLNTPARLMEASGTSGQKCVLNGVLNFSVMDGWWVEGYRPDSGWQLSKEKTFDNEQHQDELDAEIIYSTIEQEIAPLYYKRDEDNIPQEWISMIKSSIINLGSYFNTGRMLKDYCEKYYKPMWHRKQMLMDQNYSIARSIAEWKERVSLGWNTVKILNIKHFDINRSTVKKGDKYLIEVTIDKGILNSDDIRAEIVIGHQNNDSKTEFVLVIPIEKASEENNIVVFRHEDIVNGSGTYDVAVRVYAYNTLLESRYDFPLIKWA